MKSLRDWRAQKLLTIRDLAQRANVANQTVVQIEHGRISPRVRTIRRLCEALAIEPSDVAEFNATMHPEQVSDEDDVEARDPIPPTSPDILQRLQPLVDEMPATRFEGVSSRTVIGYILSPDGTVRYASPSFARIMGQSATEQIGSDIFEAIIQYVYPDDQYETMRLIHYLLVTPGAVDETTHRVRQVDGAWHEMRLHGTNLIDNPVIEGIILCASELVH